MPADARHALGLPPLDDETRQKALADPGPSWREWFLRDFVRTWALLGFFVLDVLIFVGWYVPLVVDSTLGDNGATALATVGLVASMVLALYLEFLAYRYLWYRALPDEVYSTAAFHRTWLRPSQFGRWTPEYERLRKGLDPWDGARRGPNPAEFL